MSDSFLRAARFVEYLPNKQKKKLLPSYKRKTSNDIFTNCSLVNSTLTKIYITHFTKKLSGNVKSTSTDIKKNDFSKIVVHVISIFMSCQACQFSAL